MIMDKEKLKKDYENACNAYLEAFCEKHEFTDWIIRRHIGLIQVE